MLRPFFHIFPLLATLIEFGARSELSQHLEDVLNDLCAFLSIICDYEILPIYYDYSICSQNKYIHGRIIPIWKRRRIPRVTRSWPTQGIHFMANITSFLECCPTNRQFGRGIKHLKITVYESTVELKLMAACSAIEYFYSYWFWEIDGCKKLINESSRQNSLVNIDRKLVEELRACLRNRKLSGKSPQHDPNHGNIDHSLRGFSQTFIILT